MDWIVYSGTVLIPDGISFEQACFIEPVNTLHQSALRPFARKRGTVLVIGQGPIGLILATLAKRAGFGDYFRFASGEAYTPKQIVDLNLTIDASEGHASRCAE